MPGYIRLLHIKETSSKKTVELWVTWNNCCFFLPSGFGLIGLGLRYQNIIFGIGTKSFASIEAILPSSIAQTLVRNIGPAVTVSISWNSNQYWDNVGCQYCNKVPQRYIISELLQRWLPILCWDFATGKQRCTNAVLRFDISTKPSNFSTFQKYGAEPISHLEMIFC